MEPQMIDYYNEMPHMVNVIDKMNEEYEEVIQENKILKQKLLEYDNIDTATNYLHELINEGIYNDISGPLTANRDVACWKKYPFGIYPQAYSGKCDSLNYMWDEQWIGVKDEDLYKYDCPYAEEGSPPIDDIIKEGYVIKDILNIACPHKGAISNAAIIVPDKYTTSKERINLYKGTCLQKLYEFKASDIIKFYKNQIDTLPNKLIYKHRY